MQLWNLINQMPTYAINQVVRPKIIQNDKSNQSTLITNSLPAAVELIQAKIESDKRAEELQKMWYQNNRQEIRAKFI
jgi:hypothetical protein